MSSYKKLFKFSWTLRPQRRDDFRPHHPYIKGEGKILLVGVEMLRIDWSNIFSFVQFYTHQPVLQNSAFPGQKTALLVSWPSEWYITCRSIFIWIFLFCLILIAFTLSLCLPRFYLLFNRCHFITQPHSLLQWFNWI